MTSKLSNKLRDPKYRTAFVASQINISIPFQIKAILRNRPGWTQDTLAARAGMLQPRISDLMTPGKARPNIETLRRIAAAFDCGLMVRFVPFSELMTSAEDFDPTSFNVPDFEHDLGFHKRFTQGNETPHFGSAAALQFQEQRASGGNAQLSQIAALLGSGVAPSALAAGGATLAAAML